MFPSHDRVKFGVFSAIANITGDLATTKKTLQTLNNRINGMHSPKVAEQELMMQLLANQGQQKNGKIIGGRMHPIYSII